jgi:HEAT repeat protein
MNVKDYRAQVEAQINLNSSRTLSAAPVTAAVSSEASWDEALAVLTNLGTSIDARKDALQVLQAGAFLGHKFDPVRARYADALRSAVTDPDPEIRHSALDVLIDGNDTFARQKLTDGLRGIATALLPPAAALALLARDDHGSASVIARDLLTNSVDQAARAQAVRVLGSDPNATGLLADIMKDKDEFREVRRAGAVALRGLNPQLFQDHAVEILRDGADFDDIKSTVGGALERSGISLDQVRSGGSFDEPK